MTTEERLEQLESKLAHVNRRSRWVLGVAGLVVAGVVLAPTLTKGRTQKLVSANEFILEDEDGKPRANLFLHKGGAGLSLTDETGVPRAILGVGEPGPWLALIGEDGIPRATLRVQKDPLDMSVPVLSLLNAKGKTRVGLALNGEGPILWLSDENGKNLVRLGVAEDQAQRSEDGAGLKLFDEKGNIRASLTALKDGPSLLLGDEKGKRIWSAP